MAFFPSWERSSEAFWPGLAALLEWSGLTGRASLLAAALVLVVWAALTGALHLDGWADCCDALFVPVDRARSLEIMKDPRVGGFGVVGLMLLLLVKLGGAGLGADDVLLPAGAGGRAGAGAVGGGDRRAQLPLGPAGRHG